MKAIHHCPKSEIKDGKSVRVIDHREVTVICIAAGYAMVRRPKAGPYCAPIKELELSECISWPGWSA